MDNPRYQCFKLLSLVYPHLKYFPFHYDRHIILNLKPQVPKRQLHILELIRQDQSVTSHFLLILTPHTAAMLSPSSSYIPDASPLLLCTATLGGSQLQIEPTQYETQCLTHFVVETTWRTRYSSGIVFRFRKSSWRNKRIVEDSSRKWLRLRQIFITDDKFRFLSFLATSFSKRVRTFFFRSGTGSCLRCVDVPYVIQGRKIVPCIYALIRRIWDIIKKRVPFLQVG